MNKNPREHIALITGASAGIGLELTRKLLSEDWQVIALNRSDFPAEDVSDPSRAAPGGTGTATPARHRLGSC